MLAGSHSRCHALLSVTLVLSSAAAVEAGRPFRTTLPLDVQGNNHIDELIGTDVSATKAERTMAAIDRARCLHRAAREVADRHRRPRHIGGGGPLLDGGRSLGRLVVAG